MKPILLLGICAIAYLSSVEGQCGRGNFVRQGRKTYLFSWENRGTQGQEFDWAGAQNACRRYCMNLVSLESPQENNFVKQRIAAGRQRYIWTSGRKNGNLNDGWFWSGSGVRIGSARNRGNGDWSHTGGAGIRQPDNRENTRGLAGYRGNDEQCLSILNNFYNDGIKWHDVACYHVKPFVCEN